MNKIVLPSGSVIDYKYNYDGVHSFSPFGIGDYIAQETIDEKKLTHDATFDIWDYDIGDSFGIVSNPDDRQQPKPPSARCRTHPVAPQTNQD